MSQIPTILEFLPSPFDWVYIPSGEVVLHWVTYLNNVEYSLVQVDEFYMSKYSITNAQYNVYVKETGRQPREKLAREKLDIEPLHPIADLLWVEAMEFCDWLSEKAGYLITLPTNAQWQFAAQGDDNRKYPWGDVWDTQRCNSEESQIGRTTTILQYPEGASPFGVMDMIGNTCEWCLTNAITGENKLDFVFSTEELMKEHRIFAGGHFGSSKASCEVTRFGSTPIFFPYITGIRLVTEAKQK